jgi:hypothetical protein
MEGTKEYDVSQAQNVKGRMFSLICESWTYKLNIYIYDHLYRVRESKTDLVGLSEGTMEGGRGKEC